MFASGQLRWTVNAVVAPATGPSSCLMTLTRAGGARVGDGERDRGVADGDGGRHA